MHAIPILFPAPDSVKPRSYFPKARLSLGSNNGQELQLGLVSTIWFSLLQVQLYPFTGNEKLSLHVMISAHKIQRTGIKGFLRYGSFREIRTTAHHPVSVLPEGIQQTFSQPQTLNTHWHDFRHCVYGNQTCIPTRLCSGSFAYPVWSSMLNYSHEHYFVSGTDTIGTDVLLVTSIQ